MTPLGIGIIGCGTISSVHLNAINSLEMSRLVSVCDLDTGLAEKTGNIYGCMHTDNYTELLHDDNIHVVHILTPHYLHTTMAIEALNAGKHVVLEKPVGIHMGKMLQLKKIAKNSQCTIGVTLQNRFNTSTLKINEIINKNILGKFVSAKGLVIWFRDDTYYSESSWRGKLAYEGGGLLINQAIHTIDLMDYIGSGITHIQGMVCNHHHPNIEVEDTALATLHYKNGGIGSFYGTNNYGNNTDVELEFIFKKGTLRLLNQDLYLVQDGKSQIIASDLAREGCKSYWGMCHLKCIEDIYLSIIENRNPHVTIDDAIRATELVLGIYESSKNKKPYIMTL